jgi:hypothetical protein
VKLEGFEPADLPAKFEAGTPPIVSAIGLGTAIDYLQQVGIPAIHEYERLLTVLGCGASLLLRDEALWTPAQTLAAMRERGVTNAGFPPAYLQALARDHSQEGEDDPFALSLSKGGHCPHKSQT